MSNNKHFADLLKVCSILPALAIMPAMAEDLLERQVIKESKTYNDLTVNNIVSSVSNNGGVFYLEDVQDVVLTFKGNSKFSNNSLNNGGMGGVIGNGWLSTKQADKWTPFTPGGKIVFDGNSVFENNTTNNTNGAGAIFNYGVGSAENPDIVFNGTADFVGNTVTSGSNAFNVGGGAIHHRGGMIVFNNDAVFTKNSSASKGGAIFAAGDMIFNGTAQFNENTAQNTGGALTIAGSDVVFKKDVSFKNNSAGTGAAIALIQPNSSVSFSGAAVFHGNEGTATLLNNVDTGSVVFEQGAEFKNNVNVNNGTLQNIGELKVKSGDFVFVKNTGTNGGGIKSTGSIDVNTTGDVLFEENSTTSTAGAMENSGVAKFVAENVSFLKNTSDAGYAGAVFNSGDLSILGKKNIFKENIAKDAKNIKSGGGAIHNRGAQGTSTLIIGSAESENLFEANKSNAYGGAIVARAFDGEQEDSKVVINGETEFIGNSAVLNGGAVWNSVAEKNGTIGKADFIINGEVDFVSNTAGEHGGAIFNGGKNATVDMSKAFATFNANKATVDGGAIYNDADAVLKIGDANFTNNRASYYSWEAEGYGGAIFAKGDLDIVSDKKDGAVFSNNIAFSGGAVYGSKNSAIGMEIKNALFNDNHAIADAGALGIFNNDVSTLNGVVFRNNTVAVAVEGLIKADDIVTPDGGGAIQLGGTASADLTDTHFVENKSGVRGGAISARHGKDYELNISESSFTSNNADTNGGAIANVFAGALTVENVNFIGNKAGTNGGAIYNGSDWNFGGNDVATLSSGDGIVNISGENVFSGNVASDNGGAIYNGADATINMSGVNTFVNNIANKGANDIYNAGTLNITGGTTLIGGGIAGNGILTLADGATLDIANTTVKQSEININGTVALSILSNRSYGRLIADDGKLNVSDTAKLQLSVGGVGEYNIFDGNLAGFKNITYGESYLVEELDNGYIKVTTKSVEDLAADTGLTTQAAGAVAALANSRSDKVQHISLVFQEALNSGNKELIEQESKKLNPEDKPVAQSVASSVQNQVLSLATGRMAGGVAMGRAGGDESQENGFWMHGLFNKSKLNDQFHGYTRGVAFGMDTVIDGKYTLGGGLAFNNSDVHSDGRGAVDIDSKTLFVYGQYKPNKWFANMALTYTLAEYDEETSVAGYVLSDRYDVDSYGAQIMGGYDFNTGITTEAGLRYLHIAQDEYTKETGAQVAATSTDLLTSVAGVKYSFAIENDWAIKLQPELRAALTYDLISEADAAVVDMPGVASYQVDSERLNRLGGEFGIGLTADYQGLKVTLMYDLDLHKDYTSQTGMIKFRTQF